MGYASLKLEGKKIAWDQGHILYEWIIYATESIEVSEMGLEVDRRPFCTGWNPGIVIFLRSKMWISQQKSIHSFLMLSWIWCRLAWDEMNVDSTDVISFFDAQPNFKPEKTGE